MIKIWLKIGFVKLLRTLKDKIHFSESKYSLLIKYMIFRPMRATSVHLRFWPYFLLDIPLQPNFEETWQKLLFLHWRYTYIQKIFKAARLLEKCGPQACATFFRKEWKNMKDNKKIIHVFYGWKQVFFTLFYLTIFS